ncbi:MAG: class I SAM-dependent methyltransferase, partial [Candidatus Binataceae bacterium]
MSSNPNPGLDSKPRRIREMFASIVPRYDLVNSLMTMGLDHRWRRETVAAVTPKAGLALDIATGTGELAFELVRQGARLVIAADFCPEMLVAATKKPVFMNFKDKITLVAGDTLALPFADGTFDGIVNGFMLRNVADLPATFAELCRVLKPGGSLACLDLTPRRGPMRR